MRVRGFQFHHIAGLESADIVSFQEHHLRVGRAGFPGIPGDEADLAAVELEEGSQVIAAHHGGKALQKQGIELRCRALEQDRQGLIGAAGGGPIDPRRGDGVVDFSNLEDPGKEAHTLEELRRVFQ